MVIGMAFTASSRFDNPVARHLAIPARLRAQLDRCAIAQRDPRLADIHIIIYLLGL